MSATGATMAAMRSVFQPGRLLSSPKQSSSSSSAPSHPTQQPPLVVLLHGLESYGGTWDGVMARIGAQPAPSPSILAVDLRGHGYTPPGDEDEFSPATLAADVIAAAHAHNPTGLPFIVVGHSMGGRIAMRLSANYPDKIRACVIEDMDARPRGAEMSSLFDYPSLRAFTPVGDSTFDVAKRLCAAAPLVFDAERVEGYIARGRVVEAPGGAAVTLVQPLGFALAYDRVLASEDGLEALKALAGMEPAARPELHMWRAPPSVGLGEGSGGSSASTEGLGGVEWMKALGGAGDAGDEGGGSGGAANGSSRWVFDTVFEGAGHSVHNTRQEAFVAALNALALDGVAAPEEV